MEQNKIVVGEILFKAFYLAKLNIKYAVPMMLSSVILGVGSTISTILGLDTLPGLVHIILAICVFTVYWISYVGLIRLAIESARGNISSWDLFRIPLVLQIQLALVGIVCGFAIGLAFLLLIVPGVILMLKWSQMYCILLDSKASWFESLSFSSKLTNGNRVTLLKLFFFVFIICIPVIAIGILAFKLSMPDLAHIPKGSPVLFVDSPLINSLHFVYTILMSFFQVFYIFVSGVTYQTLLAKYEFSNIDQK